MDERSQKDGFVHKTDGFTYAIDEDGDLLWSISLGAYRRRMREAEAAEPPIAQDS